MRVYRRDGYRSMPWKNGMGRTEEILVRPDGAGLDDFDLRLSIAHVGSDGPFSRFPGIDRSILALEGHGMWLDAEGREQVVLRPGDAPFAFSGDLAIASRNIGGPTLDLNLMTRRGRCHHVMRVERIAGTRPIQATTASFLIALGSVEVSGTSGACELSRFDCLELDSGEHLALTAPDVTDLVIMEIFS